nr:hypothetical protein Xcnt_04760 [Xanthomonas campestris pv. centellae]
MDSVVSTMNTPGKKLIHQARATKSRPTDSRVPHSAAGGGLPSPRKLSADAHTMIWPTPRVTVTSSGRIALGRMCRSTIRHGPWPSTRAAST